MSALPSCAQAERAVGWATHTLEPGDEDALVAHLPSCHMCRETVRQTEELMALLAAADEQVVPRAQARAELVAAVATTAQTPRELREPPLPEVPWGASPAMVDGRSLWNPARPTIESPGPDQAEANRRSSRQWRIIALVATVAFTVIGIGGLVARQVEGGEREATVQAQEQTTQRILADATSRGARHAVLNAPSGAPLAVVVLDGAQRLVTPVGLAPNAENTAYVLWGLGELRPVPLGNFDVASIKGEPVSVGSMERVDTYSGYAISIENGRELPDSPSLLTIASGQVTN